MELMVVCGSLDYKHFTKVGELNHGEVDNHP